MWVFIYVLTSSASVLFTIRKLAQNSIPPSPLLISQGNQGLWSQILFVPPGLVGRPSNAQGFHAQEASGIIDHLARQTVKHTMFMMIYVVQSYEIDCIYNAHQCGVIWGSICWILFASLRKRYFQKVGTGLYVLIVWSKFIRFSMTPGVKVKQHLPIEVTLGPHSPSSTLLKMCHTLQKPQGIQYQLALY